MKRPAIATLQSLYHRSLHRFTRFRVALLRAKRVEVRVPVLPEQLETQAAPIFVIAPHRSGTSLFRRLLNAHPNIFCPPESHFLQKFFELANSDLHRGGLRGIVGLGGRALDEFIAQWAAYPSRLGMAASGKKRWADKTPDYVFVLDALERLFGPNCVYICIFRDPLDVATSIYLRGWRFGDYDADLLENAARYVADAHSRMRRLQETAPDRVCSVSYADMVARPEPTLKGIFDFLQEPWSPEVLRFYEKPHGLGIEDPIVTGTRGFNASVGRWRELKPEQQVSLRRALDCAS